MRLFISIVLLMVSHYTCASGNSGMNKNVRADVYYYGFDVERITGILESEIKTYGCHFLADISLLRKVLKPTENGSDYMPNNVRAVVQYNNEAYFIDRNGFVRLGGDYFVLDKNDFTELLVDGDGCPD